MCVRQHRQLTTLFLCAALGLAAVVANIHAQGPREMNGISKKSQDGNRDLFTHLPTQDTESEVHSVTTISPMHMPNHQPILKGLLLPEHLLTRDFQGDQHFFWKDGSAAAHPTMPGSLSVPNAEDAVTRIVSHEDAPAFSDIATTATAAATSPLTTFSPTTPVPPVSRPQRKSAKEKTKSSTKVELTTHSLTTQVTPFSRGNPVVGKDFPMDATHSPMSTMLDKGQGRDTVTKSKTSPDHHQQEEGTSTGSTTVITTTTITTMQTSEPCSMNFTDSEGNVEILQPLDSGVECSYLITVYLGYGIEVQVLNVSVMEGEQVMVEDTGGQEPFILANESVLMRGLVLRSWSNQISIRFRGNQRLNSGFLRLHYQAFVLSCSFPKEPAAGEVSVTHLHAGGEAFFRCFTGYKLQGPKMLTCRNATTPYWSGKEPRCVASCGGMIKNATYGRIVSPGFPGNYSNNLTCHWVLEAPEGQRLHIHFEKVALAEDDDRLLIKNGNNIDSPPIYDSYEVEYLPNEGVLSTDRYLFVEFTTDGSMTSTGAAVRYEAFAKGMCYEPFVKYGNFSSSDSTYNLGAVVEFSCDPGYTLEQGSVVIECVDSQNPQWNETEPACRAVCSGEITDSAGVVLSPNWPEAYDKGQDCIWGIHVEEDKRIMLDIQVLNLGKNDQLTFYDGDDLTANILGQYSGTRPHFKLYTSMADVTIQFQSDPATNIYGYNNGFVVHFFEVPRNDTCPELPEIPNGWKSTSHPDLIHGTVVTYQCYPGFTLVGSEILMCQWDLTWSGDVPRCDEVLTCRDPGNVEHSRKVMTGSRFAIGATVQFICNKGYILSGSGVLTCYNRDSAVPKWSDRLPKCIAEKYEPCRNPGAVSTSVQSSGKAFYQAGETLTFSCNSGYELQGGATIYCVPGHPSQWNSTPPACRAASAQYVSERRLDDVNMDYSMEGTNITLAVFIPTAIILVVVLGIYVYFAKFQGKSVRMPASSPPYDNMMEESAFDNPIYESGHWQTRCRY
uniref:Seizure related 6 homolog a n=1 Tax=Nothobranchius korthausae TaxID=1143690 RepID=A0A1A8G671_9TELE